MRFIADAMFGTLAKWMRVLGYDTVYAKGLEDGVIVALAREENRILITRDKDLARRVGNSLFINSDVLEDQISKVTDNYPVDKSRILTRCLLCNSVLIPVSKSEVEGVPPGVLEREKEFQKCEKCDKYFWPATHYENMVKRAGELIPGSPDNNLLK